MSLVQKFGLDERRVSCAPCDGDRKSRMTTRWMPAQDGACKTGYVFDLLTRSHAEQLPQHGSLIYSASQYGTVVPEAATFWEVPAFDSESYVAAAVVERSSKASASVKESERIASLLS